MNLKKMTGYLLYHLLGRHLPSSMAPIGFGGKSVRALCGKLILSECGKNVNIERGAIFSTKCTLGDYSGIGVDCRISGEVHIGKNVMMGPECVMITRNHCFDQTDVPMMEQGFQPDKPIYIGDDVWLGRRAIILPGVKIGRGAIVGAGSVVTHDVADYDIVAGNPARVIRNRKMSCGQQ